jgi:hypothetical protein
MMNFKSSNFVFSSFNDNIIDENLFVDFLDRKAPYWFNDDEGFDPQLNNTTFIRWIGGTYELMFSFNNVETIELNTGRKSYKIADATYNGVKGSFYINLPSKNVTAPKFIK